MMLYSKESLESQFLAWAVSLAKDEFQLHNFKSKASYGSQMSNLTQEFEAIKDEIYDSIESARDAFALSEDVDLFNVIYKHIVEYVETLLSLAHQISMPNSSKLKKVA